MTSIDIPNSVTSIEAFAFSDCTGLTAIDIPHSVTSIGWGAFYGCIGLTSIDIPNNVTSIGRSAFEGCTGLTSINISNSVTNIEAYAFYGCTGLTSIDIPNSVTTIGISAFRGCTSLNKFFVKEDNKFYFATDGVLFQRSVVCRPKGSIQHANELSTLLKYPPKKELTKYVVNDDTTSLGCCAFEGAQYLEEIILHDKLCSFGDEQTFASCVSLKEIHIPPKIECITSACFSGCKALEKVYVCDRERLQIEKKAFERCISIKGLHFRISKPENITVATDAFDENTYNNCVLFIPSGTRWAYRHHPILGKIKNIEIENE